MAVRAAALIATISALAACTPTPAPAPERLAADQTLSFPIAQDPAELDPALISSGADVDLLRNVFGGLYRFDDQLNEVPDVAAGQPGVSTDGLTYTFHLRHSARFSNGDPITAADVVYSWNRAAVRQGDYAYLFDVIAGYADVAAGKAAQMRGLASPDPFSLEVTLVRPAGYFPALVATWPYWLVDQNVIASAGESAWFTNPATLVGSGPFRMTARTAGQSMDFAPVIGWFGGSTGRLTHVHVEIVPDMNAQIAQYESGVFSLIGYGRQGLNEASAKRYTADATLGAQLSLVPYGTTYWIGFNWKAGPFAGDAGRPGREAFSAAIDREALAGVVCAEATICTPASGGLLSRGLRGFLGDGADARANFDAAAAKAEYTAWDPTGVKAKGLTYTYDTSPVNKAICDNLSAQWQTNLGVNVACVELDRKTFLDSRNTSCSFTLFRMSWNADYDSPQDWFDNLFVTGAPTSGSCYSNQSFDSLSAAADGQPLAAGLADYRAAGRLLLSDAMGSALLYGVQAYLVQSYVKGVGGNALYDDSWTEARILVR